MMHLGNASWAMLAVLGLGSGAAHAAGFALIEQSGSGMGNAFAGGAAAAEDASTVFFNPAGMVRLPERQVVIAAHLVDPAADFNDSGSVLNPALTGGASVPIPGEEDDGGVAKPVPNFYYVNRLNPNWTFGLGVNAPFGLATEYDEDWIGRYHAVNSDLMTVNINPALAVRVNDRLALGFGVNAQYIEAELSNKIDSAAVCFAAAGPVACAGAGLGTPGNAATDSAVAIEGDGWGYGFNLGLLYAFNPGTRVGLAYRSKISQELEGTADFTRSAQLNAVLGAAPVLIDTGATAAVDLPETLSLSVYHEASDRWAFMADVTWTKWDRFDELVVDFENPAQTDSVTPEAWENSLRYAVGATYKRNDRWVYRVGLAYDETPVPDAQHRTPRIPGNGRTWLALGFGYKAPAGWGFDMGYAHLFVDDPRIDNEDPSFGHRLVGSYDASVDILSAQLTWSF